MIDDPAGDIPGGLGAGTAVRVAPGRGDVDEWAVVLAAVGIPHWVRHRLDGWALMVASRDAATALETLDAYDRENSRDGVRGRETPSPSRGAAVAGVGAALLLIGFFGVTGARAGRSAWFQRGSADADRMLTGEWWRAITALTLHADAPHLLANAVAGALLISAVCAQLGPGVGVALVLLAGVGGNALTAVAHGGHHVSVGASTAVFGALGILAGLRIVSGRRVAPRARQWWVVLAAGLALLTLLGTAPDADVLAHLFGALVGGVLGSLAALVLRAIPLAPVQWALVAAAAAAVVAAWRAAV